MDVDLPQPFQIDKIQPDFQYTGNIIAVSDSQNCAILINGKLLTGAQFQELVNMFEGWQIDIKFHE